MVQQKVDVVAGEVVAAMLQLSRPHETRLQEDRSAPLAETAITAAVTESIAAGHAKHLLQPDKVSGTRASQLLQAHVLICVLICVAEVLRCLAADTSEVRIPFAVALPCTRLKRPVLLSL